MVWGQQGKDRRDILIKFIMLIVSLGMFILMIVFKSYALIPSYILALIIFGTTVVISLVIVLFTLLGWSSKKDKEGCAGCPDKEKEDVTKNQVL